MLENLDVAIVRVWRKYRHMNNQFFFHGVGNMDKIREFEQFYNIGEWKNFRNIGRYPYGKDYPIDRLLAEEQAEKAKQMAMKAKGAIINKMYEID